MNRELWSFILSDSLERRETGRDFQAIWHSQIEQAQQRNRKNEKSNIRGPETKEPRLKDRGNVN